VFPLELNWAERWAVNNPLRVFVQSRMIHWMKGITVLGPEAVVSEVGCGRGVFFDIPKRIALLAANSRRP